MTQHKRQSEGFTAIELMITLVIVVVMATIAAPSMVEVIRASRLTAAANQLQADMQVARREAIRRNLTVLMCPSTSGTCGTGTASSWASGWVVCWATAPGTGCDATTTANPNPIRVHGAVDTTMTMTSVAASSGTCGTSASALAPLQFNSKGELPAGSNTVFLAITGTWASAKKYCVSIANTGSINLAKPS